MDVSRLNVLTSIKMCVLSYGDVCVLLSLIHHLLAANHHVYYCTFASPIQYRLERQTTGGSLDSHLSVLRISLL